MNIVHLENAMYQLSNLFLVPVLALIIALFLYAFYLLGNVAAQYRQRRQGRARVAELVQRSLLEPIKGYPLISRAAQDKRQDATVLEIHAMKLLEPLRVATRVAPMLGLVGTMIPMGPALKALADGNVQGISENLIVAFTSVIFGLIAASITFWLASVRKQWLAEELNIIQRIHEAKDEESLLPVDAADGNTPADEAVVEPLEVKHALA